MSWVTDPKTGVQKWVTDFQYGDPHTDPNAAANADHPIDPANPVGVDDEGNGLPIPWDWKYTHDPRDPLYGQEYTDPNSPVFGQPDPRPTAPTPAAGGSAYDQAKAQMDAVFAKYGRTPRADEYAQWIGPNGYIMSGNYGGGQKLPAYTGGAVPQYWLDRMAMHATGDYYGNGTTPGGPTPTTPGWQDPGATDYSQGASHTNAPAGPTDPGQNPFATHPAGGVWIPSLGQWVPGDHPLAQTPGAIVVGNAATVPATAPAAAPSGTPGATTPASIQDQARDRIMELLRTPRDVDPEKLRTSPEMQAVQLQAQRTEERDRGALAERAAANGWSGSGGFEGGLTALREKRGATEMDFMGQLALQQMERNREDIQQGIEFALNQGQFDQAQALQRELAALEAAIEREKISANLSMNAADNAVQRELGLGDQELRRMLGMSDLELRRYLGQIGSSFDFANLEWQQRKDELDRATPPEI